MKCVIIGGSGHFEYALSSKNAGLICAYAKGSDDEDISRLSNLLSADIEFYDNYLLMLDEVRPDIAIVNPHYYLNGELVLNCLKLGINVFCEKPLAFNPSISDAIYGQLIKNQLHLLTMQVHRYEPWFCTAFDQYKNGAIGDLLSLQGQKSYKMGLKPNWMQDKSRFGGIIPWVGTHAIDWAVWFAGNNISVISAYMSKKGNKNQGEVESMAQISLRSDNVLISLNLDYLRPESAIGHGDDKLRVVGSEGIIEVSDEKVILTNEDGRQVIKQKFQINIFDDFVNSIKHKKESRISVDDIKTVQRICWEAEAMASKN